MNDLEIARLRPGDLIRERDYRQAATPKRVVAWNIDKLVVESVVTGRRTSIHRRTLRRFDRRGSDSDDG